MRGLFTYPVLMAADILLYDSNLVPVGVDQVQHIEVTRDIATKFNLTYQREVFVLPEAQVMPDSAKVVGIDGEKMSKSYGNTIELFEEPKKLRKKLMSIKTDSTPVEQSKNPETCSVFTLYKLFANASQQTQLAERYRAGGMGYGEAKQSLFDAADAFFSSARERRQQLAADATTVEDVLQAGALRARAKAQVVLNRAREACGLSARS